MSQMSPKSTVLIEPFAGGGIISLTALFESFVEKAVMAELDDEVAAVWQCIAGGQSDELARQILAFEVTKDTVISEIQRAPCTQSEKAFQTILKNRTFHGGILAHGSGLLKYGENGKGVRSRWYPKTLARRLLDLQRIASKIDFRHVDGLQVIQEFAARSDAAYFIDPPYTAGGKKAGRRLYNLSDLDHEYLFSLCNSVKGNFLMTYDNAEEVKTLARRHGFQMRLIPMTNTHHATMEELVVGRDLSCLDRLPTVHEPHALYCTNP